MKKNMTTKNTWLWSFPECQSIYNHHLVHDQVFWNNKIKENISCKTNLPVCQEVATLHLTLTWLPSTECVWYLSIHMYYRAMDFIIKPIRYVNQLISSSMWYG